MVRGKCLKNEKNQIREKKSQRISFSVGEKLEKIKKVTEKSEFFQ